MTLEPEHITLSGVRAGHRQQRRLADRLDRPSTHTAENLLALPRDGEDRDAVQEAVDVLASILAGRSRPAKDVQSEARKAGIAEVTLRRAKGVLGIKPKRMGYSRPLVFRALAAPPDLLVGI
jgi:hypothetical protein